jgi:hypothetical protein
MVMEISTSCAANSWMASRTFENIGTRTELEATPRVGDYARPKMVNRW